MLVCIAWAWLPRVLLTHHLESHASTVAVSVECESNQEHFERTVGTSTLKARPPPPASHPPPSPSKKAIARAKAQAAQQAAANGAYRYDSIPLDARRPDGKYYDAYEEDVDEEKAPAFSEDENELLPWDSNGLLGGAPTRGGVQHLTSAHAQQQQRPHTVVGGDSNNALHWQPISSTTGGSNENLDSLLSSWIASATPSPPSREKGLDELLGFGAFLPPPPPRVPQLAVEGAALTLEQVVEAMLAGGVLASLMLLLVALAVVAAICRAALDALRAFGLCAPVRFAPIGSSRAVPPVGHEEEEGEGREEEEEEDDGYDEDGDEGCRSGSDDERDRERDGSGGGARRQHSTSRGRQGASSRARGGSRAGGTVGGVGRGTAGSPEGRREHHAQQRSDESIATMD